MVLSRTDPRYRAVRAVAVVAGIFSIIVATLLAGTFIQLALNDPLDSPALQELQKRSAASPDDEQLREQIRALDLMARKAYFVSQWQMATAAIMLLIGVSVLLIALRLLGYPSRRTPKAARPGAAEVEHAVGARRWVIGAGGLVLVLALLAIFIDGSWWSSSDVDMPTAEELAANWTNFRGPGANGVATVNEAPTSWDGASGENILWKVEVPLEGFSSPVVWEDLVILTGADRKSQAVFAFDAASGEIRWRTEISDVPGHPAKAPRVDQSTGYAAPTVACDGRGIYAIFATGDIAGLEMDGSLRWSRNLGVPDNHYGHSSSLMMHGRLVIVQYDQNKDSKLLGLDSATGDTMWRTARSVISWSSPILVDTGDGDELILTNSKAIDAFDPATGEKLWGLDVLGGEMGPSAVFHKGWVYAANDYASAVGIKLGAEPAVQWEFFDVLPDTASPAATGDFVFLAASYGIVVCLNATTGELLWEHEFDDGFYASPIVVGDLVYLMDMGGVMHIFKAADTYTAVADPELGEDSVCTPAFVGDRIYVRSNAHLYCIGS